jgi:hypothetical protein
MPGLGYSHSFILAVSTVNSVLEFALTRLPHNQHSASRQRSAINNNKMFCLAHGEQMHRDLRLCKMELHGLYLAVIFDAGRARRPRRSLTFKCSESLAITAERPLK